MTQRQEDRSKCCWKNGSDRPDQHEVATNLQFVKNVVSAKHIKAKCNKTRSACTGIVKLEKQNPPTLLLGM